MTGDEIGDLADVHLEQAASNDEANHEREDSRTLGLPDLCGR